MGDQVTTPENAKDHIEAAMSYLIDKCAVFPKEVKETDPLYWQTLNIYNPNNAGAQEALDRLFELAGDGLCSCDEDFCIDQGKFEEIENLKKALENAQPDMAEVHDNEWFFRWIARGKAGYAGMTMEQCVDAIWHSPGNPYSDNNPWEEKEDAIEARRKAEIEYGFHKNHGDSAINRDKIVREISDVERNIL